MSEIVACGYIGVRAHDPEQWRDFAETLGMQVSNDSTSDRLLLRMDDRAFRVVVESGEPGVAYVGWELADRMSFGRMVERLRGAGVDISVEPDLARQRGVAGLARCADPGGNVLEFFHGAQVPAEQFVSPTGTAFVTSHHMPADLGFGHVVMTFEDCEAAEDFYLGLLGFRLSDVCLLPDPWRFAHVNARHHSIAFGPAPGPSFFHHFMLEVTDLDMVGLALDRLTEANAPITTSLGRHVNDRMFSFYVRTPSGFEIEYGHGGRIIDDKTWTAATYIGPKIWGHHHDEATV